jgi:hypothetical protein
MLVETTQIRLRSEADLGGSTWIEWIHLDLSGFTWITMDLPASIGCSAAAPFSKNVSNRLSVPVQLNKASSTTARVRVVFYAVTKMLYGLVDGVCVVLVT